MKASLVVAILTDPAECEALFDVLPAAYCLACHDHDQVGLAISEYVAIATGNALIAITVEADFEVRPLVHLRAAFRSCGLKKDP